MSIGVWIFIGLLLAVVVIMCILWFIVAIRGFKYKSAIEKAYEKLQADLKRRDDLLDAPERIPNDENTEVDDDLKKQLQVTEKDIADSAEVYNGLVSEFEAKNESFPSNVFVGFFYFGKWSKYGMDENDSNE